MKNSLYSTKLQLDRKIRNSHSVFRQIVAKNDQLTNNSSHSQANNSAQLISMVLKFSMKSLLKYDKPDERGPMNQNHKSFHGFEWEKKVTESTNEKF